MNKLEVLTAAFFLKYPPYDSNEYQKNNRNSGNNQHLSGGIFAAKNRIQYFLHDQMHEPGRIMEPLFSIRRM